MSATKYKRILLKLSGEALAGRDGFGIDREIVDQFAQDVAAVKKSGIDIAIVIGGGNIFRGLSVAAGGGDRVTGDHLGMMATIMNALVFGEALQGKGLETQCFSGLAIPSVADTYNKRAAQSAFSEGKVVLFAGGTGNPYFTTDTAAALRAVESECDVLFKATQVDGIYAEDPKKNPDAERFDAISHNDALQRGLNVMDTAAFALAKENRLPIVVFSIHNDAAFFEAVHGRGRFTLVHA